MRKIVSIACAVVLLLSFSACGIIKGEVKMPESYEEFVKSKEDVKMISSLDEWNAAIKALKEEKASGLVVSKNSKDVAIDDAEFLERCVQFFIESPVEEKNVTIVDEYNRCEYYFFLEKQVVAFEMDRAYHSIRLNDETILSIGANERWEERDYLTEYVSNCEQLQASSLEVPKSDDEFQTAQRFVQRPESAEKWAETIEKLKTEKIDGIIYSDRYYEAASKSYLVEDKDLIQDVVELLSSYDVKEVEFIPSTGGESVNTGGDVFFFVDGKAIAITFSGNQIFATMKISLEITNFDGVEAEIETLRGEFRKQPELK